MKLHKKGSWDTSEWEGATEDSNILNPMTDPGFCSLFFQLLTENAFKRMYCIVQFFTDFFSASTQKINENKMLTVTCQDFI